MIHNKLVRDKIPAEIDARGATCTFKKLDDEWFFLQALINKIVEEAIEVRSEVQRSMVRTDAHVLEELADLQSVLDCLLHTLGYSSRQLNDELCRKMREKGRFTERIFLMESREPGEASAAGHDANAS